MKLFGELIDQANNLWPKSGEMNPRSRREDAMIRIMCLLIDQQTQMILNHFEDPHSGCTGMDILRVELQKARDQRDAAKTKIEHMSQIATPRDNDRLEIEKLRRDWEHAAQLNEKYRSQLFMIGQHIARWRAGEQMTAEELMDHIDAALIDAEGGDGKDV